MIFVDTNYFLRFLFHDNENQYITAKALFLEASEGKQELISSTIVFFEIYWVLRSYYKKAKQEMIEVLRKILNLTFIDLPERQILLNSLELFSGMNFDLEDCYNLYYAKTKEAKIFKTFDQKLEKEYNIS